MYGVRNVTAFIIISPAFLTTRSSRRDIPLKLFPFVDCSSQVRDDNLGLDGRAPDRLRCEDCGPGQRCDLVIVHSIHTALLLNYCNESGWLYPWSQPQLVQLCTLYNSHSTVTVCTLYNSHSTVMYIVQQSQYSYVYCTTCLQPPRSWDCD